MTETPCQVAEVRKWTLCPWKRDVQASAQAGASTSDRTPLYVCVALSLLDPLQLHAADGSYPHFWQEDSRQPLSHPASSLANPEEEAFLLSTPRSTPKGSWQTDTSSQGICVHLLVSPGHWSAHLFVERKEQDSWASTNRSTFSDSEVWEWRASGDQTFCTPVMPLINSSWTNVNHFSIQVRYYRDTKCGSGQ